MMLTKPEKLIFRELCGNSRISAAELSAKLGMTRYTAMQTIDSANQKLRLKYTLELDYKKLGFSTMHVLYFKFSKKPKVESLKNILSKSIRLQFFATAKGDFDAVAFVLARDPVEYSQLEVAFQASLIDYGAEIKSAEVTRMRFGFVPLTSKLLELSSLDDAHKKILIALNENSRARLNDISKGLAIDEEMVNYYVKRLVSEGMIKRFTVIAAYSILSSSFAAFINYQIRNGVLSRIEKERHELYFTEPEEFPQANNVQEMWSISGTAQAFMMGSFESFSKCKELIKMHNDIYKPDNPEVKYAEISDILVGAVPFRNLDMKKHYDTTGWPLELI